MIGINGARLLADLRELATFGKFGTGVDRVAFSEPDLAARSWLLGRMKQAGLDAAIDRVGNIYGRMPGARRTVLIGSHTDSVPKGGWLDGALGVIYGLEIARAILESQPQAQEGVDVISFQDEEGTYLPCVGSRSFCGDIGDQEVAAARSKDGRTLNEALAAAGYDGAAARLDKGRHLAFLEAHIEQGPRLEAAGKRIGVVTGIVGIRRMWIAATGQADHAGTTPMALRKDAGAALFAFAGRVAAEFPRLGGAETVWNIGSIALRPGAANVVPAEGELQLEFRDTSAAVLDRLDAAVAAWLAEATGRGPVKLTATPTARIVPTSMTPALGEAIAAAAGARGVETLTMPSGAGHDAMVTGRFMPSAMLFIPSIGGRSHDIVEDTEEADIILGCEILADTVTRVLARG